MKTKILPLILAAVISSTASAAFDLSVVELSPFNPGTSSGQIGVTVTGTGGSPVTANNGGVVLQFGGYDILSTVNIDAVSFGGSLNVFAQNPSNAPLSIAAPGGEYSVSGFGGSSSFSEGDTFLTIDYSVVPGEALPGADFDVTILATGSVPGATSEIGGMAPVNLGTATVAVPEPSSVIFFSLVSVGLVFRFWKNRSK